MRGSFLLLLPVFFPAFFILLAKDINTGKKAKNHSAYIITGACQQPHGKRIDNDNNPTVFRMSRSQYTEAIDEDIARKKLQTLGYKK